MWICGYCNTRNEENRNNQFCAGCGQPRIAGPGPSVPVGPQNGPAGPIGPGSQGGPQMGPAGPGMQNGPVGPGGPWVTQQSAKKNKGLLYGLIAAGAVVLVAALIVGGTFLLRSRGMTLTDLLPFGKRNDSAAAPTAAADTATVDAADANDNTRGTGKTDRTSRGDGNQQTAGSGGLSNDTAQDSAAAAAVQCSILGHIWQDATCETPRTCSRCGQTEGDPLGHDWLPATYAAPETCARCGQTRGAALTLTADAANAATVVPSDTADYRRIPIAWAEASSELDYSAQGGASYPAALAVDGLADTCWQEGAAGDGIGEYLELVLERESRVDALTFQMGYAEDAGTYTRNGRPRVVRITFDGGDSVLCEFPDEMREHMVVLAQPVTTQRLRVEILSVYGGTDYDDTCISEAAAYVRAAPAVYLNQLDYVSKYGKIYFHSAEKPGTAYNSTWWDLETPGYTDLVQDAMGNTYTYGIHLDGDKLGPYYVIYDLDGLYTTFTGTLATYAKADQESVQGYYKYVEIYGDDQLLFRSDNRYAYSSPQTFTVDVTGVRLLRIQYSATTGSNDLAVLYDGHLE